MKKIFFIVGIILSCFSCGDDHAWKIDQSLVDRLQGEWLISSIYYSPADSVRNNVGKITFESCSLKDSNKCNGFITIEEEITLFNYRPENYRDDDILNEIGFTIIDPYTDELPIEDGAYKITSFDNQQLILSAVWFTGVSHTIKLVKQ